MGVINWLIDFVLHIDRHLGAIITNYGILTYLILFVIVFLETGLVVTPFLPGDSLLFVAGTFAAKNYLNIFILFIVFSVAAIIGDSVNYFIGNFFGEKVFMKSRLFKREHLEKTKEFYKKHGGKTIIFARFIPIIRTFAPFVAGIGKMDYYRFFLFNVIGGISWVLIFLFGGYYFGRIPVIEKNLTLVIYTIIFISILPIIIGWMKSKLKKNKK
jgi:membrane-associated protein